MSHTRLFLFCLIFIIIICNNSSSSILSISFERLKYVVFPVLNKVAKSLYVEYASLATNYIHNIYFCWIQLPSSLKLDFIAFPVGFYYCQATLVHLYLLIDLYGTY
ncbi:hypothetical protein VNO78_23185 [Psophocarpus tetragonolobus]|uniref:Uncharacterized protein n=1 Tax=Psophocarpus tetragonolobus TaxID=3891 RepID=A0AAN9S2U2_PSOTE